MKNLTIKQILKYERLKRGFTQEEFAEFLGIKRSTLARYEAGSIPEPNKIKKLSSKLKIDLAIAIVNNDKTSL